MKRRNTFTLGRPAAGVHTLYSLTLSLGLRQYSQAHLGGSTRVAMMDGLSTKHEKMLYLQEISEGKSHPTYVSK